MAELRNIIDGCKRKERKAQDVLYNKYSGLLFGVCMRYTKSQQEAEDVVQEGWVKIYKNIASFNLENSFEGWMRRIMVNTAITHYRRNLKHAYQEDVTEAVYGKYHAEPVNDADFTREELMNVINALPPGYKMVFNMYVIEGYKHKEIAKELGIDINTSKSQLSRAKKYLQKELLVLSEIKL